MTDYVSQLQHNIDERVFFDRNCKRNRLILKLKYIDGLSYNEIANLPYEHPDDEDYKQIKIEVRQIRRVCKKYEKIIYKGLKCPHIDLK